MMKLIKPETLVAVLIGILGSCTSAFVYYVAQSNQAALREDHMVSLQADVKAIRESIANVPLYGIRIAQLEAWATEQKGFNGAIDGRLRTVEAQSQSNADGVADLKRASGVQLRR